jgi:inner membrane protein
MRTLQYAMIGTALSVFYLVLTALSEHLDFAGSYARAAGLAAGAVAGVCYSLLYLLVLSEEYALLFGALALFFLLAATMVATRKLDWYRVASSPRPGT